MKITERGLALIRRYEGCRNVAYRCPAGVWTIGYGHTGPEVCEGLVWDMEQINLALRNDIVKYETKVNEYDHIYHWTQNEFDALVSFAYNLGSIKNLTNFGKRSRDEIRAVWCEYCHAGGKKLVGLERRRKEELALFNSQ